MSEKYKEIKKEGRERGQERKWDHEIAKSLRKS